MKFKTFVPKKEALRIKRMAEEVVRHALEFKGAEMQRTAQLRRSRASAQEAYMAHLKKEPWSGVGDPLIRDIKQATDVDLREKYHLSEGHDVQDILGYPADWQCGIRP